MLVLSGVSKPFCQLMVLFIIAVCLSGVTVAFSNVPQPPPHTDTSAALLPPLHFPKDDYDENMQPELGKALPPKVFPKISESKTSEEHNDSAVTSVSNNTTNQNDTEKPTAPTAKLTPSGKLASEVPDLLNTDGFNITEYEGGTDAPIQNDTITVTGPNVVNNGKTHEEDGTVSSVESKEGETKNDTVHQDVLDKENDTVAVSSSPNITESNHEVSPNITLPTTTQEEQRTPSDSSKVTESSQSSIDTSVTTELDEKNATVSQEIPEVDTNVTTPSSSSTEGAVVVAEGGKKKTESSSDSKEKKIKTKSDNRTVKKDDVAKPESSSKDSDISTSKQENPEIMNTTVQPSLKDEVETVTGITQNTISHEDIVEDSPVALAASQQHSDHSHASTGKSSAFLQPTESAAILAGVFVGIALLGYVGLLIWRRILEKRYGNREMLVNEDDFYDTNDLRNFEL